jgi:hypothetical protein
MDDVAADSGKLPRQCGIEQGLDQIGPRSQVVVPWHWWSTYHLVLRVGSAHAVGVASNGDSMPTSGKGARHASHIDLAALGRRKGKCSGLHNVQRTIQLTRLRQ